MKQFFTLVITTYFLLYGGIAAAKTPQYLRNMADIPLMDGVIEDQTQGFVFDTPEGQVIESVVFSEESDPSSILKYYDDILPRLGWKPQKTGFFVRNDEQLTVKIEKVEGGYLVIFNLFPESD